ncbi:MAG TPA: SRPBCC domain-containing protein [Nocardioidaceae bacterium]|nr:SRPBCC domain-containing protein [Nocardioidaceae bacterium]
MAARLQHVTEIGATPERVWAALTDLQGWKSWNVTLTEPDGALVVGSVVKMKLTMDKRSMPMRQKIIEVSPPSVLRWQSRFGPSWMFSVMRTFRIEQAGEGRSRLEQSEEGTGLLAGTIFRFTGPPTVRGYAAIAEGLDRHLSDRIG